MARRDAARHSHLPPLRLLLHTAVAAEGEAVDADRRQCRWHPQGRQVSAAIC